MRFATALFAGTLLASKVASQEIWDIWQTTWDRSKLFTYFQPPNPPIEFTSPGTIGAADIVVDDTQVYQTIWGFGASLTDSSALLLSNLKTQNSDNYWSLLDYLFNPTDGANSSGFTYLRVPLGASDFSANLWTYDDTSGDTSLTDFNIDNEPDYVFRTIYDIQSVNPYLRVHVVPWSPPAWMKTSGTMDGGDLNTDYINTYANYLLKCLQGFQIKNIVPFAISIQNEPENSDSTYPSCYMPVAVEAQIGVALRALMDDNGFSGVRLIGYEHNWNDAGGYPVQLMEQAGSAFAGVAFHCYAGDVQNQSDFYNAYPTKEIYFTECSGTLGSDWWSDIKWYMDNLFITGLTYHAQSGLMWNLALNGSGLPKLPGTDSCGGAGCRGVAQINGDGTWSVNQEFYAMGQASKAILPRDADGPWGQRVGVSVGGAMNWALVVGAYVTGRVSSSDWLRYSLVVLNWADNSGGEWDPQPVQTTIEFRDMQATYTFPVGVTTLWWYAVNESSVAETEESSIRVQTFHRN
ncbi:glycoside hydrolase [Gloeophyllum trabeum ATCC 11539]|uniref:Glycoside hydrolase n=1 Tax=Gloeophyllum trabeum (strain ATCC 11539 / FP-39264 / Madison 617) TaxID=670483 RepID=S7RMI1_GLOTA|nr:glycoside hydrolase [Gloeophyllum trabeum ATCC 11539]EPQ55645.1 glycoside hydrolase [Gloeophyllum trabeum ATCC 11539]